jgi:hypothetical protein
LIHCEVEKKRTERENVRKEEIEKRRNEKIERGREIIKQKNGER